MAKVRASFIVYNMPDVQELKDFVVARVIENAKGIPLTVKVMMDDEVG